MLPMTAAASFTSAERDRLAALNRACLCLPLDRHSIDGSIARRSGVKSMAELLRSRQNLFAGTAVFVSEDDISAMQAQIVSIEETAKLDAYRRQALTGMDRRTAHVQGETRGMFMGFDFHIGAEGPRLIEVNSNAGGLFLIHLLEASSRHEMSACAVGEAGPAGDMGASIVDMFLTEWRMAGRTGRPRSIAIVDDDPPGQYLYPEMLLAREVLERAGFAASVIDPGELTYDGRRLMSDGRRIDMVYNRLTDFRLADPANHALRAALQDDRAVVSPAPRHHALLADKQNLVVLSDRDRLLAWGLPPSQADALDEIPRTLEVTDETAQELWTDRRNYFFKPARGYAGRGAYRGDKLTRRVWSDILAGDYIAQAFVPPSLRGIALDSGPSELKFDIRIYTYAAKPLGMAARMYRGQTTNFRTEGGGFAPVVRFPGGSCRQPPA